MLSTFETSEMARHAKKKGITLTAADFSAQALGKWKDRYFLTFEEAAEFLGLTKNALYHKKKKLEGTFTKVSGQYRFVRGRLIKRAAKGVL